MDEDGPLSTRDSVTLVRVVDLTRNSLHSDGHGSRYVANQVCLKVDLKLAVAIRREVAIEDLAVICSDVPCNVCVFDRQVAVACRGPNNAFDGSLL